jgi:hypothetical protein
MFIRLMNPDLFDGYDSSYAEFSGGAVDFHRARFSGDTIDFTSAELYGVPVDLTNAGSWSRPSPFDKGQLVRN